MRVANLAELTSDSPVQVVVDEQVRILVRAGGDVYALDGICTHQYAELADGEIEDDTLWCPLHGGGFDFRTGAATCLPVDQPLRRYGVRLDGDDVFVSRDPLDPS